MTIISASANAVKVVVSAGPQGPAGPAGPQGDAGPVGPEGPAGPVASQVAIIDAITLAAGSTAGVAVTLANANYLSVSTSLRGVLGVVVGTLARAANGSYTFAPTTAPVSSTTIEANSLFVAGAIPDEFNPLNVGGNVVSADPRYATEFGYAYVIIGASGHIALIVKTDGTIYAPSTIEAEAIVADAITSPSGSIDQVNVAGGGALFGQGYDDQYLNAVIDSLNRLAFGLRPDGTSYMPKAAIDSLTAESLTAESLVVTGSFVANSSTTRVVSPTGSDSNDGSESSPWLTFTRLKQWINELPENSSIKVIVKSGAYTTSQANPLYFQSTGLFSEVYFEKGVSLTAAQIGTTTLGNVIGADRGRHYFYLNGATITLNAESAYPTISDNGIGVHASGKVFVDGYDENKNHASFVGFIDGASNHNTGYLEVQGCDFSASPKGTYVHVNTSRTVHRDCVFNGLDAAVFDIGTVEATAFADFYDCKFLPDPAAISPQYTGVQSGIIERCQIGTTTQSVQLEAKNAKVNNCYLNLVQNREHGNTTYSGCFGKYSNRNIAGNNNEARFLSCVFIGPGSFAPSSRFFVSSVNFGKFYIYNTIITGYERVIDVGGDATRIAAINEWAMNGLCLFGNTTNFDAGINTPAIVVSSSPALGAANTTSQTDYEIGAGSPCRYAGVNLGNIGLPRETP